MPTTVFLFHLFDAVIMVVTVVLEFVLHGREEELVGLIVLLRLWRINQVFGTAQGVRQRKRLRQSEIGKNSPGVWP